MNIPLTAAQQTEIAANVRKPRYLVEIKIGASTLRFSTGDDITWDTFDWVKSGVEVSDIRMGKGAIQYCKITLINEQEAYSDLVITTGFLFRSVRIWQVYGVAPYASDDPILKFTGEIVKIPTMGALIIFECTTKYGTTRKIPTITLGPPHIRHLPFPGQKFTIGNEIFTVEDK